MMQHKPTCITRATRSRQHTSICFTVTRQHRCGHSLPALCGVSRGTINTSGFLGGSRAAAAAGGSVGPESHPHQQYSNDSSSSSSSLSSSSGGVEAFDANGHSARVGVNMAAAQLPEQQQQQQQQQGQGQQQLQEQQQAQQESLAAASLSSVEVMPPAELAAAAQRYAAVALLKGGIGCVLLLAPAQVASLLQLQASALEVGFARLTGMALLFRALLAASLRDAALHGRLHSMSCQRVMLGCLLPVVNHYLAFKKLMLGALPAVTAGQPLLYVYPVLLAVEFYAHVIPFQVYQPYFLAKLLWPAAFGALLRALMPPLPEVTLQVPQAVGPVTAGGAVLLGQQGARQFGGRIGQLLARVLPKLGKVVLRTRASKQAFKWLLPAAGPPLARTSARLLDFALPRSPQAWAYAFMALGHLATLFNAYRAEVLFCGQVTPLSQLLKQCWSAAFLAAAFACDALKSAADRDQLAARENRNLNLALAALELLFLACVGACVASGCMRATPYSSMRLATSAASAAFCLKLWWDGTQQQQQQQQQPQQQQQQPQQQPQQQEGEAAERRDALQLSSTAALEQQQVQGQESGVLSAAAVVALTLMTALVC